MNLKNRVETLVQAAGTQIITEYSSARALRKYNLACQRAQRWKKEHPIGEAQLKFARATSRAKTLIQPLIQEDRLPILSKPERLSLIGKVVSDSNRVPGDAQKTVYKNAIYDIGQAGIERTKKNLSEARQAFRQLVRLVVTNK